MVTQCYQNKYLWLTGASTGIGLAILKQLLANGAIVTASARDTSPLSELANHYKQQLTLFNCDITQPESINNCIQALKQYPRLDIAILNAGNCLYMPPNEFHANILKTNIQINLFGLADCIEATIPLLEKSAQPQLVATGSAATLLGIPRAEGYGASKAAIHYLMETLQVSLTPKNIAVSLISPGFIKTPLTDRNEFAMPFLMSAEKAAAIICRGIYKRKPIIEFPWPLIWSMKLIKLLPYALRLKLLKKTIKAT